MSKGLKYVAASPPTSGNDPPSLDKTGAPICIASSTGIPNPSESDAHSKAIILYRCLGDGSQARWRRQRHDRDPVSGNREEANHLLCRRLAVRDQMVGAPHRQPHRQPKPLAELRRDQLRMRERKEIMDR